MHAERLRSPAGFERRLSEFVADSEAGKRLPNIGSRPRARKLRGAPTAVAATHPESGWARPLGKNTVRKGKATLRKASSRSGATAEGKRGAAGEHSIVGLFI